MKVITTCKELMSKKYKVTDIAIKEHYVDLVLQIKSLSVCIFTEYERSNDTDKYGGYYFEANVRWVFSDKDEVSKTFEYSREGLEAAYEWIDEQRVIFAQKILE